MGYTTDFNGRFDIKGTLTNEQMSYINQFSNTRRMKRDVNKLMELYKGKYGYPGRTGTPEEIYGNDGEFFVGSEGYRGQDSDSSIIDYNTPPGQLGYQDRTLSFSDLYGENERRTKEGLCQPGLWCQWVVSPDGFYLEWDGGEKFYSYIDWLKYLIKNFFQPWGVELSGEVTWQGEDSSDMGKIIVKGYDVTILHGEIVYS